MRAIPAMFRIIGSAVALDTTVSDENRLVDRKACASHYSRSDLYGDTFWHRQGGLRRMCSFAVHENTSSRKKLH